ncbi:MAG: Xaa-Pro peptidase family protein [Adlercreutzia sp.]|nr:Xaa-Pro peptidase family protein [Adlercreutzia sp.]MEE0583263.1 Xaa-Pro peptidase family protein [Adlercreutzia sp.]
MARLRETFPEMGVGAFLVRDTSNVQWLTAFDDVFDEEAAHALYVCPDHAWLHTDSRYVTACENAARHKPLEVSAERETHAQFAAKRWGGRPAGAADAVLGIEDGVSLAEYRRLQKAFAEADAGEPFVETDGVVVGLRAVKDRYEIARMRGAQSITDAAFEHIVRYMRPGMMERQVQLELEEFMLRHGAQGLAFPSIVATGPNGASPHAIPGATMLEAGQCVVLDFGARSYGYCSDMTRTVFLGEPDPEMRAAWDALREANESVEAMLRPGVTGKEGHEQAEAVLAAAGFGGRMGHGLGHGVGIDIHEEPVLAPRNERPLVAGNVVTVEPGIYLPGKFGMRLEDFGVVTADGFDVFTNSTHDLVVI